ncbi:MAG: tryptophan synthase subunit alpha [Candidatus Omnitrophota bacterium]|nr:tryptophan synthase subunit alpha [Candidatus Omnitrophota bacterium]
MNRIDRKFKELKTAGEKAFIVFITAGYPSLTATEKLVEEFDRIGVSIVELGVPFTDPMADGPVIQEASTAALKKNTHLVDILNMVKRLRGRVSIPICLMTYYNPVFCFGEDRFIRYCLECGVDGVIIPDLPPEEAKEFLSSARKKSLDIICFLAPTSTPKRVKFISRVSRGFIYYVSLTGTTGARSSLPAQLSGKIKEIKRVSDKPVCAGFGVSTSAQVKEVLKVADGVIVGSAIVKKIKECSGSPDMVRRVGNFISHLKSRDGS